MLQGSRSPTGTVDRGYAELLRTPISSSSVDGFRFLRIRRRMVNTARTFGHSEAKLRTARFKTQAV